MGYMGLGMQSWISKMKPRKFLGKRSKPDGGGGEPGLERDINDYYHLKPNKLTNVRKRKYKEGFRKEVNEQLKHENHKQRIFAIISLFIGVILIVIVFRYFNTKFELF